MRVITLTNHKGGVGKTTSAFSFAIALILYFLQLNRSVRVLLVDLDSQAQSSTVVTSIPKLEDISTISDVLADGSHNLATTLQRAIQKSKWHNNLDVLCAAPSLDDDLLLILSKGEEAILRLAKSLESVSGFYDFVVIDTPPNFQINTKIALYATTDVIIPVEPEYLASSGLASAIQRILWLKRREHLHRLNITGILPTKVDLRMTDRKEILHEITSHAVFGKRILGIIPTSESIHKATRRHESIFNYQANGAAAIAYMNATQNLIERIGKEKI